MREARSVRWPPRCHADIDWVHIRNMEWWPLEGACVLVYPKDPYSYKLKSSPPEGGFLGTRPDILEHPDILNPDSHSRPAWANLYHLARNAIIAETLPHKKIGRHIFVPAAEFLAWARGKGVRIPPELDGIESPRPVGTPQVAAENSDLTPLKPQKETPVERSARFIARHQELKAGGSWHPTKTLAEEEGISRARVREVMKLTRP